METSKILNIILASTLLVLTIKDGYFKKSISQAEEPNKTQSIIENIHNRKSVRTYTDQKPTSAQIDTLLRAAMAAPTAANKQPWAFIVVTDKTILEDFSKNLPYAKMAATAHVAIVVCGDISKALEGESAIYWVQDCSAATENLLLAAEAIGLGAVWTGVYPDKERVEYVATRLNLPKNLIPLNVIPIGYPTGIDKPKEKFNPSNIYYNNFPNTKTE